MEYLTPEQAAEILPFGNADWIRQELRAGRLEGFKVGGRWLIEPAAIEAMVREGANRERRRNRRRRAPLA